MTRVPDAELALREVRAAGKMEMLSVDAPVVIYAFTLMAPSACNNGGAAGGGGGGAGEEEGARAWKRRREEEEGADGRH